jgi:hypothetical protein
MKNQEISTALDFTVSHEISNNHFEALANATPVQVVPEYYNMEKLGISKDVPIDIIVTDYITDGFVKVKATDESEAVMCDAIEFLSNFSGSVKKYVYSGSSIVRRVADLRAKFPSMNIPLRITYKGKAQGKNGFKFDDFEILGLKL